jgi:hypothetical protein
MSQFKKATPPKMGEAFGNWTGRDLNFLSLPGGGTIGFDLNNLTLADYRKMTTHYQIHSSLAVLSFLLHQSDWTIECSDKKIAKHVEENLRNIWTSLSRALSESHWSGFAPNVLQWENDLQGQTVQLTKIKDLIPEECFVNWKYVDGYAPPGAHVKPKLKIYDGIRQFGAPYPIPVEATCWYPLLMRNGDYYGTKLLKPAFTPWFFSMMLHLFANRYYERFGEPTPIGRAPMDDDIQVPDGSTMNSRDYMLQMLSNLRSRSVVVLPNDRNPEDGDVHGAGRKYDYEIEYLESQMRGADFERYMTRLDEEMSIGLFTPILLLRTADVGSYNLGQGHMQMYLWMLNSLNGDRKDYIDKYILSRMVDYNFSPNAPRAKIKFRKMGNDNSAMIAAVIQALINGDKAIPDLDQIGEIAGLTMNEVKQLKADPTLPVTDPVTDPNAPPSGADTTTTAKAIKNRVAAQVGSAFGRGEFGPDTKIDMGHTKQMRRALHEAGIDPVRSDGFFRTMEAFTTDSVYAPFDSAASYMEVFGQMLDRQLERITR